MLEKTGRKSIHFLRPRRFGKTLFTSMLDAYYDINAKDEFESLFKGTYIYEHPTKEKNSYYTIRFDFSGLHRMARSANTDDSELLKEGFHNRIYNTCTDFLDIHHIELDFPKGIDASDTFSYFIGKMRNRLDVSLFVIIDE